MNNALQAPSLYQKYRDLFRVGAAVTPWQLADPDYRALIRRHFNSVTAENNMKPQMILDHVATLAQGDPVRACFDFSRADRMLAFAKEAGISVRFHTLVWHNQTPRWFFARDGSDTPDAPTVSAGVLQARQQAYIREVMTHVNACFPGVVYAWDVVNEAIEPDHGAPGMYRTRSPWYQIMGEEFVRTAFLAARQFQLPGQKLYYNDFNTFHPVKRDALISLLEGLLRENLVDGMGMQAHLQLEGMDIAACETAARAFAGLGLALQVTEMDIHCTAGDDAGQQALAKAYGAYFDMLIRLCREGIPVESVTFWGVTDADSWLRGFRKENSWPLLFTGDKDIKPAFTAVLSAPDTTP